MKEVTVEDMVKAISALEEKDDPATKELRHLRRSLVAAAVRGTAKAAMQFDLNKKK